MHEKGAELQTPPLDVAQAQLVLGYEATPLDPGQLLPGQVDERRLILEEALAAQEEMRDSMAAAARSLGMPTPAEEVAAWRPNVAQVDGLRHRLTRLRKRARILDSIDQFIDDQRLAAEAMGTPMRPHQQDMVISTSTFMARAPRTFSKGGKGGHINAATGVGKTGVINIACAAAKYIEDPTERVKIVVVVDSVNTGKQTHGKDGVRGFGKFAKHLDVGMRYAESHDTSHDITVMPAASARILMERGEMPDADVVILDEADVYARGKPGEMLRDYCADKIAVGLSASIDDVTRDLLPHEIYNLGLPESIHKGLLAETTAEVRRLNIDWSKIRLPDAPALRKASREEIKLRARLDDIKKRIVADIKNGRGGIIVRVPAGDDINIARAYAKELCSIPITVPGEARPRTIRAKEIGGKAQTTTSGRHLQGVLFELYEGGDIDVFVTVKAIERGWDNKTATNLYDADTGGNERTKLQIYGRVPRLDKSRPHKLAHIVNYYDEDRPDQFTGVMALGGQAGQDRITVRKEEPEIIPRRAPPQGERSRTDLLDPRLLDGIATTAMVDTITVEHDKTAEPEPQNTQELTFGQVADRLGISQALLARIYKTHGFTAKDTITVHDLNAMLELSHPALLIKPLPEKGYTSDEEVLELAGIPGLRVLRLRTLGQYQGFLPKRFLRMDGTVGRYYPDDQVLPLIAAIKGEEAS